MTTRTWLGGGNNSASNPSDWSPFGTPQGGDTLYMTNGTMNVIGPALSDDPLNIIGGTQTINLTSGNGGSAVINEYPSTGLTHTTVNITGLEAFQLNMIQSSYYQTYANVNITPYSLWDGGFNMGESILAVHGGYFDAASAPYVAGGHVTLDTDVVGNGTISDEINGHGGQPGHIEFMRGVTRGTTIDLSGGIVIDKPASFQARIDLEQNTGEVILRGLKSVTSYSYKNEIVSFFNGANKLVDTLRLADATGFGTASFAVDKERNGSLIVHGLNAASFYGPASPGNVYNPTGGVALAFHQ